MANLFWGFAIVAPFWILGVWLLTGHSLLKWRIISRSNSMYSLTGNQEYLDRIAHADELAKREQRRVRWISLIMLAVIFLLSMWSEIDRREEPTVPRQRPAEASPKRVYSSLTCGSHLIRTILPTEHRPSTEARPRFQRHDLTRRAPTAPTSRFDSLSKVTGSGHSESHDSRTDVDGPSRSCMTLLIALGSYNPEASHLGRS